MPNELYHYGVLGMKWGVRRYQNYDGSYTKKGLQRYNKSMSNYQTAKAHLKTTKSDYKQGKTSKDNVRLAKQDLKAKKHRLVKDYKHLKQDKLGDQGKLLYAQGKRITLSADMAAKIETGIATASYLLYNAGKTDYATMLAAGGTAINAGLYVYNEHNAKRLRAYYGHTSNY